MDLATINDMWKKDSVIDQVLLDEASIRIPQLHQKYLTLLTEYTLLLKKKRQDLKRLEHTKNLYFSGRALPEVYEDAPFPYKVMKNEAADWVGADEEIQKVELKINYYEVVLKTLEEILKQVHQMSYNIKNAVEWRRFTSGA